VSTVAHLNVNTGTGSQRVELSGDGLTIGRAPDNGLPLADDPAVSRHHAVLASEAGEWVLRDLGSSNGTSVNGHRIDTSHRLLPGDVIVIGEHRLVFDGASAGSSGATQVGGFDDYLGRDEEWSPEPSADDRPTLAPSPKPARSAPPPTAPDPSPAVRTPAARQEHLSGVVSVTGVARSVVTRKMANSQTGEEGLFFRVDRYDASGDRLPAVGVQFAPFRNGHLTEGEEVLVSGRVKRGTIHAREVRNLTTGAELTGSGGWDKVMLGCAVVAFVLVVLFIIAIAASGFLGIGGP